MSNDSQLPLRVHLSPITPECEEEFLQSVQRSRNLHRSWAFPPCNHEEFAAYLERVRSGNKIPHLIRRNPDNRLVGVINVSEPVMGVFCSAYLGFYSFAGFERLGYMTEGLALVLDRAFGELGFHRLEANVQPANVASSTLVSRVGFRKEGFSPRYLFIDGAWRDHDRWAILSDEWPTNRHRLFASRCADGRQSPDA
jgi:[ribosomal protein S5]-alanine N-acetyltransferase